jgi:O-antigen/teichoic acid export membrane protein
MMILATALTAVFQFALARFLLPGEYSLLAALLAVAMIVGVPLGAIQAAVARDVAAGLADGSPERAGLALRESAQAVGRVAPFVVLAAFVVGVPLAVVGHVHNFAPLIGLALTLACGFAFPIVWGGIQGMARFRALGLIQVGYAVAKLALGVALAAAGAGVTGVMLGVGVASTGALVAATLLVLPLVRVAARSRVRRRLLTKYNVAAAVGLGSFAILTTVDIVVARLTFTPPPAGAYSAASIGSRALLLIPAVVTTVLFPHVATVRDPLRERRFLLGGTAAVAAFSAPVVALFWLWPSGVLDLTFGSQYSAAEPWLGPLALAMAMYAVATVYQFHFLSLGRTAYALIVSPIVVVQLALFLAFHSAPRDLVHIQLGVAALLVIVSETYEQFLLRHSTPRE